MYRTLLTTAAFTLAAGAAVAESHGSAPAWTNDPSHSQIVFAWDHGPFSVTRAIFYNYEADITFDPENPAASSVSVSIPLDSVSTAPGMIEHWQTGDFFGDNWTTADFTSTSIEVTGDNTANITGDLTLNGVTNEVVLETTMNGMGDGPMGGTVAGFTATTTLVRSDFNLGLFTPFIPDELPVEINIEASPAES